MVSSQIKPIKDKGYYWVKLYDTWIIAEFDGINWYRCGSEELYSDHEFDEIEKLNITHK